MIIDIRKAKTLDKALKVAGLSWDVESAPLVVKLGNRSQAVPGYRVVTRADTGQVLSIVGERFEALGQSKLFKVVDAIAKKTGAEFRLAGSLDGGRRVFVQISLGGLATPDGIERRLTFFDTHDSSSAPFALATPVRVASEGFNNVDLPDVGNRVPLRRTDIDETIAYQADLVIDMASKYFEAFEKSFQKLYRSQYSAAEMMKLVQHLLPGSDDTEEGKVPTRTVNNRVQLMELFSCGAGHEETGIVGTQWGALQAVVEYVDCHRGTRVKDGDDAATRRLESGFFGSGLGLKQQAFDLLTGANPGTMTA